MNLLVLLTELIGTAAFAASGATLALQKQMDLFGVCMMGLITACGGGIMRDLFLGQLPPAAFCQPVYPLTALAVSVILFLCTAYGRTARRPLRADRVLLVTDAVGLGIFTAVGVSAAVHAGFGGNPFFSVFLGSITGVGGGVVRDVLAGLPPTIFVKHIYACASILGALLCVLLWSILGEAAAMLLCCLCVILIRLLSAYYHWSLPRPGGQKKC